VADPSTWSGKSRCRAGVGVVKCCKRNEECGGCQKMANGRESIGRTHLAVRLLFLGVKVAACVPNLIGGHHVPSQQPAVRK